MNFKQQNCPNCGNPSFPDEQYHDMTNEEGEKIRLECHDCWEDFPKSDFTETVASIEFTEEESDMLQDLMEENSELLEEASDEMRTDMILGMVEVVKGKGTIEEAIKDGRKA